MGTYANTGRSVFLNNSFIMSEHTAPYDALIVGVEGRAEVMLDGVPHTVGEGDCLLMPAHVPHAVHPSGDFKMLLVMIRGEAKPEP